MSTFEVGDGPVSVTIGNAPGPAGSSGVVTVSAPLTNSGTSSAAILGLSIGSGLSIVGGALTAAAGGYTLPAASSTVLGGIKIGSGLAIDGNGVVTAAGNYTLPSATTSTLGGVIVGAGLSVTSGTVSAAVVSVASKTGAVTLDKADVGLGSVDNTADASKPVSTAQGAADSAVQAYAIQRANHTGTQAVGTITGLGSLATQSGTFSGTSSGTNTGDQTFALTGDVTGSGTGSFVATLAASGVTAGSHGSASSVATFTVDAKGRLTAAGSTTIAIAAAAVSGLASVATSGAYADLSGKPTIPNITSGTAEPTGGSDGDLYFQYV